MLDDDDGNDEDLQTESNGEITGSNADDGGDGEGGQEVVEVYTLTWTMTESTWR